jgi:flavorubredoxin
VNKRKLRDGVYGLGAIDWERRLFDSLIPLPDGTSYNAYLVEGTERTVLLDTVDPSKTDTLLKQLAEVPRIDYIVSHHAEQDHSGSLGAVLERFPEAKVLCTPRAKDMLIDLLALPPEVFLTVDDGQEIPLGGRTLKFIYTPWVHWPETMVTYLEEDHILFSCDFFGSHLASSDVAVVDECRVEEAAKRYFAEIMAPFRPQIEKNLDKLKDYEIDLIAPSHGQVYERPAFIIDLYREWVAGPPRNLAVVAYVSMHGSTKLMADRLTTTLAEQGVRVELFDLAVTDVGKLAMFLLDAGTLVIGTPTVLTAPHPLAANAAILANALKPKARLLAVIGSYGWGGKAVETLSALLPNLKVEVLDPVLCKGLPRQADLEALDALAATISRKHQEFGLI